MAPDRRFWAGYVTAQACHIYSFVKCQCCQWILCAAGGQDVDGLLNIPEISRPDRPHKTDYVGQAVDDLGIATSDGSKRSAADPNVKHL